MTDAEPTVIDNLPPVVAVLTPGAARVLHRILVAIAEDQHQPTEQLEQAG